MVCRSVLELVRIPSKKARPAPNVLLSSDTNDLITTVTLWVRWAWRRASQSRGSTNVAREQPEARHLNRRTDAVTSSGLPRIGRSLNQRG